MVNLGNLIYGGERFSTGFRSEFIRNGFINDALKRLKELDEAITGGTYGKD